MRAICSMLDYPYSKKGFFSIILSLDHSCFNLNSLTCILSSCTTLNLEILSISLMTLQSSWGDVRPIKPFLLQADPAQLPHWEVQLSVHPGSCWSPLLLAQTWAHVQQAGHHHHPRAFPRKLLPSSSSGAKAPLPRHRTLGLAFKQLNKTILFFFLGETMILGKFLLS